MIITTTQRPDDDRLWDETEIESIPNLSSRERSPLCPTALVPLCFTTGGILAPLRQDNAVFHAVRPFDHGQRGRTVDSRGQHEFQLACRRRRLRRWVFRQSWPLPTHPSARYETGRRGFESERLMKWTTVSLCSLTLHLIHQHSWRHIWAAIQIRVKTVTMTASACSYIHTWGYIFEPS